MSNTFCSNADYANIGEVENAYPAATMVVTVEGGWMVFEYLTDYEIWSNQK